MQNNRRKARLFDLRRLPQDMARLVCACLVPLYRMKRLTPEGEKYRGFLRGGAVVAANHSSFQDPFVVGVTFWYRRMFFLVAEIVMVGWLRRLLLKGVGAVEIDRNGADIEAIRKSVDILKRGHLLTVFPQGASATARMWRPLNPARCSWRCKRMCPSSLCTFSRRRIGIAAGGWLSAKPFIPRTISPGNSPPPGILRESPGC